MIQNVLVQSIGDMVEEEVEIQVRDVRLTCFASYCPYEIQIGRRYPAELSLYDLDEDTIRIVDDAESSVAVRIDGGFSYELIGIVNGSSFEIEDISFDIDELLYGLDSLSSFEGRKVRFRVARIQIAFS